MGTRVLLTGILVTAAAASAASAASIIDTGPATNLIGMASQPSTGGKTEIETADDFLLSSATTVTNGSFTGLIVGNPGGLTPSISQVVVEIYRVFPNDSNVGRTSGPPTFSTPQVTTRVNSPSDVAFDSRDSAAAQLTFTTTVLSMSFTANNSIQPGGIHPLPGTNTGGNGAITGEEVQFNINFTSPFLLPGDHYFFVPQVAVTDGTFYWLSGQRPVVSTPFAPDLQAWTRDEQLDPDWVRVGTDIVGGTTFNGAFSLSGSATAVPLPPAAGMAALGLLVAAGGGWLRGRGNRAAQ